jgi:hypothetical protein
VLLVRKREEAKEKRAEVKETREHVEGCLRSANNVRVQGQTHAGNHEFMLAFLSQETALRVEADQYNLKADKLELEADQLEREANELAALEAKSARRSARCGNCAGCMKEHGFRCGVCKNCTTKGHHQACVERECEVVKRRKARGEGDELLAHFMSTTTSRFTANTALLDVYEGTNVYHSVVQDCEKDIKDFIHVRCARIRLHHPPSQNALGHPRVVSPATHPPPPTRRHPATKRRSGAVRRT